MENINDALIASAAGLHTKAKSIISHLEPKTMPELISIA
jgi:hypothetical protein